ncbi:MAG: hypothetical protein KY451_10080, partial [Actinobacteria bacterium]|nr:hypothetical protein [Actinomycetota bacterium]
TPRVAVRTVAARTVAARTEVARTEVARTAVVRPSVTTLPFTGSSSLQLLANGLFALVGGAILMRLGRARSGQSRSAVRYQARHGVSTV